MAETTDRSLQMLNTALEKEERGRDYYLNAANTCTNPLGREMFRMMAKEEAIHITRVKEIHDNICGGGAWTEDWKGHQQENENLQELFRERFRKHGEAVDVDAGDLEAVNTAMDFEQGAIQFYEAELEKATDPLEKEFIKMMIKEEHSHYASFADLKLFLTNPESWYTEHEKHTLDGA